MLSVYPTNAPTSTPITVVDPVIFITPRLRITFRIVESLTRNNLRCCYAALSKIALYRKKSTVTVRRHIIELCALGILRKRSIPGSIDHLFICPVSEWKVVPECPENDRTYPSIMEEAIVKDKQQARTVDTLVPEVVVSAATPMESMEPEKCEVVEQIVTAGVARATATQSVQEDHQRAATALKAVADYQEHHPVVCVTALYRVAYRDKWEPKKRQEASLPDRGTSSMPKLVISPLHTDAATVNVQAGEAMRAMIASSRRIVNPLHC
jgi:hypothetical protein